jgi:alpha-tubulin suppressor-like RCC1 family protein
LRIPRASERASLRLKASSPVGLSSESLISLELPTIDLNPKMRMFALLIDFDC